ncbi:hypothetical protein GGG16DRAFT_117166 [Schizophyllum commune]
MVVAANQPVSRAHSSRLMISIPPYCVAGAELRPKSFPNGNYLISDRIPIIVLWDSVSGMRWRKSYLGPTYMGSVHHDFQVRIEAWLRGFSSSDVPDSLSQEEREHAQVNTSGLDLKDLKDERERILQDIASPDEYSVLLFYPEHRQEQSVSSDENYPAPADVTVFDVLLENNAVVHPWPTPDFPDGLSGIDMTKTICGDYVYAYKFPESINGDGLDALSASQAWGDYADAVAEDDRLRNAAGIPPIRTTAASQLDILRILPEILRVCGNAQRDVDPTGSRQDWDVLLQLCLQGASNAALAVPHIRMVHGSFDEAFNQSRYRILSSGRFLAAIGIYNLPIFAIATEGSKAHLLCGWATKSVPNPEPCDVLVHLADFNCPVWDLQDTNEAIKFCAFLLQLRHLHAPRVRTAFEACREEFTHAWRCDPTAGRFQWTLQHQQRDARLEHLFEKRKTQEDKLRHWSPRIHEVEGLMEALEVPAPTESSVPAWVRELDDRVQRMDQEEPDERLQYIASVRSRNREF